MITLDTKHDVHWLAGYDTTGQHFYIDRHLPRTFEYNGKEVQVDKYLLIHEMTEKLLEDSKGMSYDQAHKIATQYERAAVERDGIDWNVYSDFMNHWIKKNAHETLSKLPKDLEDPTTGKVYKK